MKGKNDWPISMVIIVYVDYLVFILFTVADPDI